MMQFEDSLHGMGGQALLNTSIKSEGGVSVHNTSRGEEDGGEEKEAEEEGEPGLAFDVDSIKVMAETVGMGALPEEAARELGEEVTYRVRQLVQDSQKFMYHGKRHKLMAEDVDHALRMTGQEPLYGFQASRLCPSYFYYLYSTEPG